MLDGIDRPGDHQMSGRCDILASDLAVAGAGAVAVPLLPMRAAQPVAVAEQARFGRGEETLVDVSVRVDDA